MGSTRALLLAGVVALGAAKAAEAADLPLPPPPEYVPVAEPTLGGWYLRGDVGVGIASSPDIRSSFYDSATYAPLDAATLATAVPGFARVNQHLGDSAFVDIGIGYQYNNWLRFDVTGEYRTDQTLSTLESYNIDGALFGGSGQYTGYDQYHGNVQSSVFLANAYVDLGTWYGVTPFIGAGVGAAYNQVRGLTDLGVGGPTIIGYNADGSTFTAASGVGNGGYGYARDSGQFDLAYAAMAGVSYAVTPNMKVELGYRYLNMGDVKSGFINCVNSTGCVVEKHRYDLSSQDIRLGLRWMIGDYGPAPVLLPPPPPPPEQPIIRKY